MKHLVLTTIAAVVLVGCGPRMSIHEAARNGDIEVVKQHLAADVDVNAVDNGIDTPLHKAASFSKHEIIELLIANGANVNAKDGLDRTPFDFTKAPNKLEKSEHGAKTAEELKAEGK